MTTGKSDKFVPYGILAPKVTGFDYTFPSTIHKPYLELSLDLRFLRCKNSQPPDGYLTGSCYEPGEENHIPLEAEISGNQNVVPVQLREKNIGSIGIIAGSGI